MINEIIKKIIESGLSISFAESMTGGSLASAFTKIPGSSNVFKGSFVTYSDEYKTKFLGVKKKTITKFGVVSKEVALEMIKGLKKKTKADILVSVTGNAGPLTCDNKESIGKVFVGLSIKNSETVFELNLKGSREEIINATVEFAFIKINENI